MVPSRRSERFPGFFPRRVFGPAHCFEGAAFRAFSDAIPKVQRFVNLVDLEKCSKINIWLQKSALIEPRTSRLTFAELIGICSWYMYLKKRPFKAVLARSANLQGREFSAVSKSDFATKYSLENY